MNNEFVYEPIDEANYQRTVTALEREIERLKTRLLPTQAASVSERGKQQGSDSATQHPGRGTATPLHRPATTRTFITHGPRPSARGCTRGKITSIVSHSSLGTWETASVLCQREMELFCKRRAGAVRARLSQPDSDGPRSC